MNLLLKLVFAAVLGLLALSAYPGVLADMVFVGILLVIPAVIISMCPLCIVAILIACLPPRSWQNLTRAVDSWGGSRGNVSRTWIVATSFVVLACPFAIASGLPLRLAFAISRPAFERYLEPGDPVDVTRRDHSFDRRLGLYHVDNRAVDRRGGVYFRTRQGADGLGPDVMSHGFAYRPNHEGTPYGRSGYSLKHLFGSWYRFQASDDDY